MPPSICRGLWTKATSAAGTVERSITPNHPNRRCRRKIGLGHATSWLRLPDDHVAIQRTEFVALVGGVLVVERQVVQLGRPRQRIVLLERFQAAKHVVARQAHGLPNLGQRPHIIRSLGEMCRESIRAWQRVVARLDLLAEDRACGRRFGVQRRRFLGGPPDFFLTELIQVLDREARNYLQSKPNRPGK